MSTTKASEREKQLETQLGEATQARDTAVAERDDYKAKYEAADEARQQAEAQRDQLMDELKRVANNPGTPADEQQAEGEADEHAATKELLKRMGLKVAYILNGEPCFDENHARHTAGPDFDSLTVISAE